MNCTEARQLFDAYLDGELAPTLATELAAHRLMCADCRRALALLEVSGHIIASDRHEPAMANDFTDRLLACMETEAGGARRWTRWLYVGGPLAAAALLAIVMIGAFRSEPTKVAGWKETAPVESLSLDDVVRDEPLATPAAPDPREAQLDAYLKELRERVAAKQQAGESVQAILDLSVIQLMSIVAPSHDPLKDVDPADPADMEGTTGFDLPAAEAEPIEDL